MQRGKLRVTHVSTAGGRVRCRVRARTRRLEKQIDDLNGGAKARARRARASSDVRDELRTQYGTEMGCVYDL